MFMAGLPALGSPCSAFPMLFASVAASILFRSSREQDAIAHYGGASAVAFHHTSLFTRLNTQAEHLERSERIALSN